MEEKKFCPDVLGVLDTVGSIAQDLELIRLCLAYSDKFEFSSKSVSCFGLSRGDVVMLCVDRLEDLVNHLNDVSHGVI